MKLTKQQESEVMPIYKEWWHSYLNGDVKTYDHYLDEDYRFVGSTEAEDFLSKRDSTQFFDSTADQLAGKLDKRNSKLTTEFYDGLIFITELADAYLLFGDEWAFYEKFRLSSILRKTSAGWRFIYQHFSVPDSKAHEGETIGFEQVSKENQELRDAIKRRTIELEQKNWELEIETALERVRSRTMAMHTSDELAETASVLFREVKELGIETYSSGFNIWDESSDNMVSWMSNPSGELNPPFILPIQGYKQHERFYKAWQNKETFLEDDLKGERLKAHFKFLRSFPLLDEAFTKSEKAGITTPDRQVHNVVFFSHGYLLFIALEPIPQYSDVFKRFGQVFEQTYTRFLDLQKAEAQAREGEIQLALEQVRARTMAMQNSDELGDVISLIFEKLNELNIAVGDGVALITFAEDSKDLNEWMANEGFETAINFQLPYFDHPVLSNLWKAKEQGKKQFFQRYSAEENKSFLNHIFEHSDFKHTPEHVKEYCLAAETYATTIAFQKHTAIFINDYSGVSLSEPEIAVLQRFSQVFEQTFIRFKDLEKAEAQARESNIETALERVRARSMAMHRSEELIDVVNKLYGEFKGLGLKFDNAVIQLKTDDSKDLYLWISTSDGLYDNVIHWPYEDHLPIFHKLNEAWSSGTTEFNFSEAETKQFFEAYVKLEAVPKERKKVVASVRDIKFFGSYRELTGILMMKYTEGAYLVADKNIIARFSKVFEQTYTRFLDLQKAEAQAREAQIEAALERTRTQSMLMQHSDELDVAAQIFHEQLVLLGIDSEFSYVWLPDVNNGKHMFWAAWNENEKDVSAIQSKSVVYDLDKTEPYTAACFEAWESGQTTHINPIPPEEVAPFFDTWSELLDGAKKLKAKYFKDGLYYAEAYMKYGCFGINIRRPLVDNEKQILEKFAIQFERTYTRFLDLQKAEAQAREAQIEAALERVRARAMAMHNSDDMGQCILKMFNELTALGVDKGTRFGIGILNHEDENNQLWTAIKEGEEINMHIGNLEMSWHPLLQSARKAWKAQIPLHKYVLEGEDLLNYYRMINEAPDYKLQVAIEKLPEREIHYGFIFKHGFFYAFCPNEFRPELIHITQRFSSLFSQTYIRFLDLKKAEAQAREAEIELALERVRARTMAMNTSDQVGDAIDTLFEQLKTLGIGGLTTGLNIIKDNEEMQLWTAKNLGSKVIFRGGLVDMKGHSAVRKLFQDWKNEASISIYDCQGDEVNDFYNYIYSQPGYISGKRKDLPERVLFTNVLIPEGSLWVLALEPVSEEDMHLLKRFANVFSLTYSRYRDLQKAEAQAREAKIETALERIRSKTIGMQKSEELADISLELVKQVQELGVETWFCAFNINDGDEQGTLEWGSNGLGTFPKYRTPREGVFLRYYEAGQRGESLHINEIGEDECPAHYEYLCSLPGVGEQLLGMKANGIPFPSSQIDHVAFFKYGYVLFITYDPVPDSHDIFKRFAKVFEQSYTRFLDLQKAEAQAREAQIEAALERVRSRTMAMQKSEELSETSAEMFRQIRELGLEQWSCGFSIFNHHEHTITQWLSTGDGRMVPPFKSPSNEHVFQKITEASENEASLFTIEIGGKDLEFHYEYMSSLPVVGTMFSELKESGIELPKHQVLNIAYFNHGFLLFITYEQVPEYHPVYKRFAEVFEQTYTRFLDLQKAEAQAREAQIELSLERVRAKAMAMHNTSDLADANSVVFNELNLLGIDPLRSGIGLMELETRKAAMYATVLSDEGNNLKLIGDILLANYYVLDAIYEHWVKKQMYCQKLNGKELVAYYDVLLASYDDLPKPKFSEDDIQYGYFLPFEHGAFFAWTQEPFDEEELRIINRFVSVIDLTYKRYFDLKKAEEQIREAQIEAALERVRSRTLAMHKSEELLDVITVVSEQLKELNFRFAHVSFADSDFNKDYKFWTSAPGMAKPMRFTVPHIDIPMFNQLTEAQQAGLGFFTDVMTQKENIQWHKQLLKYNSDNLFSKEENEYIMSRGLARSIALHPNIILILANYASVPYSDEENKIIVRFGHVFEQSYTRFLDLQKAEAQTREAEIELALERIRAQAMAMKVSADLLDIVVKMRTEFIALGHEAHYFWYMRWLPNTYEKAMTAGDGTRVGMVMELPRHIHGDIKLIADWEKSDDPTVVYPMDAEMAVDYVGKMVSLGDFKQVDPNAPSADDIRHIGGLTFVMARTAYGEIGFSLPGVVPNPPADDLNTLQRFAGAFDLAYGRFEDLQKAEAQAIRAEKDLEEIKIARKKAEDALKELQATQNQLIQSEKMASLGELTAGIAHEIQNPLNFVNNFSEVSTELIDEMNEELDKGDIEEAKAIGGDLKENLIKINHHGNRAGDIVKGMLQHSRVGSGKKESTDINLLADEYLRLAYHGLRAKDKSFNATMHTDFDEAIEKINIVSQDIGRVILNLITNAFYVVNEKSKQGIPDYEPTVSVITKNISPAGGGQGVEKIQISVQDNGNGIPDHIKEKIFQPFFTTKPTGSGTGLGLSLSYDIVKAHGGELSVETKEGEGSEFVIKLPFRDQIA